MAVTIVPSGFVNDNTSPAFKTWPLLNVSSVDGWVDAVEISPAQPIIDSTVVGIITS